MNFQLEPIIVTGYHGTSRSAADKILADGFQSSENEWDWMGTGIYFWQDAPIRAYRWAQERLKKEGSPEPAVVVAAKIRLDEFVDLLDQRGMKTLQDLAKGYLGQENLIELRNQRGANRLDCAVFNFATNVLSWLGADVSGYRAACVEGNPLTPGSPIYDLSHVQLAVIDQEAILEKWIVQVDEKS